MFLNIIMLAGIGGAAVPLVLHLLNRARYRSVDWGAMMFLYGDDARQRQSAKLKQWIILAIRMALVALLAVALARPLVARSWGSIGQNASATAVIILDRSASMGFTQNGHTRIDQAGEAVLQVLASLRKGDQAALITLGDFGRGGVPPTVDFQSIADAVAPTALQPSYGSANMADGLRAAADIFDRSKSLNREVFIICDHQANTWQQVTDRWAADWRSRVATPGPAPRMVVIPVGGDESDNVAVESIELLNPPVIHDQPAEVEVRIHNFGPTPRAALPLKIQIDGHDIFSTTINVTPGASASARATIKISSPAQHILTARIDSVGLTFDDRRDCAIDVINPIGVLIVSGDMRFPGEQITAYRTSSDFIKLALAPFQALGHEGPNLAAVDVVSATATDWSDLDETKYRVIVLANVPDVTPAQVRTLEQHLYTGGGILIAPGNLVRPERYNTALYRDGAGLLPAMLQPATAPDGSAATSILGINLTHPVLHFLQGKPDPIPSATIARYFPAVPRLDAQVLASYVSGKPFLVEGNFGPGRVLLATTSLDEDWGTLPMTNFYLPFVQSAIRYLDRRPEHNLKLGESLIADFDQPSSARTAHLILPDSASRELPIIHSGDRAEVRFDATDQPGEYRLTIPAPKTSDGKNNPNIIQRFAVQTPLDESDLTPLSPQRWQSLASELGFQRIDSNPTTLSSALAPQGSARELWPVLLGTVFLLGVAEIALGKIWTNP